MASTVNSIRGLAVPGATGYWLLVTSLVWERRVKKPSEKCYKGHKSRCPWMEEGHLDRTEDVNGIAEPEDKRASQDSHPTSIA